ncbi:MAG: two-component sensor histidine kinase [Chloroflexi bacterium]|nr:two-component sensor histidine kinase [Chloroflexota bacterium]
MKKVKKDKDEQKGNQAGKEPRNRGQVLTTKQKWVVLGFITMIFIYVTAVSVVTYLLTDFAYHNIFHIELPALLVQLINAMLGFIFCFFSMFLFSRIFNPERNVYEPILEAINKISKGNFNVGLDEKQAEHNGIWGELTKSVNNMATELNKMETMRREFISNVSHEIQTPLTSIKGFAQALQSDTLSPVERKHYLEIIEVESTRLSRIAENLLKLASLEARSVKFEPKPYRLDRQIRRLVLACEPQWSGKDIDMDVVLNEVEVTADEDLLSQVWLNLIHNSLKFTPEGGRICLELHDKAEIIEFSIRDSGIGISEEAQSHIFERFYKADISRTNSNGGSGLGLSIAHEIVEMHRGRIKVASQPGQGATFQVYLPNAVTVN